jgi:hypothetical protein
MKILKNTLTALAFISLIAAMSCNGGGDDPEPDPVAKATADVLAAGNWTPTTGGITNESTPRDEWEGFTVTFTANSSDDYKSGTYTAGPLPQEENAALVWKTSGNWAFAENGDGTPNLGIMYRDGDETVPISLTVSGNEDGDGNITGGNLRMAFEIADPNERVEGFYGEWVFSFEF